jgi:hypothetical protein
MMGQHLANTQSHAFHSQKGPKLQHLQQKTAIIAHVLSDTS